MNHFEIEPYEHNTRLYLLIGLWPDEDSSIRCWRAYIVTVFFSAAIIIQTYILLTLEVQIRPIMDLMTTYLPTICFSACYYNILFHLDGVKSIQDRINSDFNNLESEEERNAIMKYVRQNKVYSFMIACGCFSYALFLFLPSFRSLYLYNIGVYNATGLVLPIHLEYCLKSRIRYFSMLPIQFVGTIIVCTVGVAYYTMVIACLQHACALFTIVTIKIDQSVKEKVEDFYSVSSITRRRREHEDILSAIEYYKNAIDFVDLLISISTKTFCVEIFLSLLLLVIDFFYLFQLLDMAGTKNETIISIVYIITTIMIIYSAFYMGQRLIDHSTKVYAQCCQIPFYALSVKTQKLLVMLIMRSLKPCSINIKGIISTSHEVFAKIANFSYSFAIICYKNKLIS